MMKNVQADILVLGAGMAGLSLCYRALKNKMWQDKSIVMVDSDFTVKNDKTWCFWEAQDGPFEDLVYSSWNNLLFFSNHGNKLVLNSGDYCYKMIRSIDFYAHCMNFLKQQPNIQFVEDEITEHNSDEQGVLAKGNKAWYLAAKGFSTLYSKPKLGKNQNYYLQHFKGWFIETENNAFEENSMHFMDFRPKQTHGCTFMYVLPESSSKALIEYTLFTKKLLQPEAYDEALREYIQMVLNIKNYSIRHQEFGVIPMTDGHFTRHNGRWTYLGSAGGDTRASTGYTFKNTQKSIDVLLKHYQNHDLKDSAKLPKNKKHRVLDSTILKVFDEGKYPPHQIFTDLFENTFATDIFKFLDYESDIFNDIRVMKSLKAKYFILPFCKSLKL